MCSARQILSVCLSDIISGAVFSEAPKYSTWSRNSFCTIGATDMNQIKRLVEERDLLILSDL